MTHWRNYSTIGGKISIFTTLLGVVILLVGIFGELPHGHVATASTATTSVTVLNTPPQWDTNVYTQETNPSASTTPTNAGFTMAWYASSSDSSNDNYYVLICNNYASPTPVNGGAPTCGAGNNGHLIAVSAATQSGTRATLSTTTYSGDPTEIFYYYAYLCDGNASGAACSSETWVGTNTPAQSPFIVNHRPTFTAYSNDAPKNPGQTITWSTTASDPDTYGGTNPDTIKLFVCKAQDFSTSTATGACGAGGTWATSTYVATNPTASFSLPNPDPKGTFGAYGYVIDSHGNFVALGGSQASDAPVIVSNVAPTISSSTISLFSATGTTPLILTNLATRTQGFSVEYVVSDQNSCQTASATPEINFGLVNVFRSGIGSSSCVTAGNHNTNNCYPGTLPSNYWNVTCTASSTSCLGTSDSDVIWDCTFPLWYNADPTDAGSQFPGENWTASAEAADTSFATTSIVQAQTGTELLQFLGYNITPTTISYGGLQPGNSADLLASTSVALIAQGNVGLDENLYGADMCPTYPTCSGNATSTIFVNNQKYSWNADTYANATNTLSGVSTPFLLNVPKTTSTTSPQQKSTYWGILVPGTITFSGSYIGENTIIGTVSNSTVW